MDEQFVDFYEILGLPLDADRNTLRKRINALYLDAQSNLDHRHFATRLQYQQLFEATLPEARFVLLDDARRAEYTALVRAFRAPPDASLSPSSLPPLPRSAGTSETQMSREAQRRLDEARRFETQRRDVPEEPFFDARGAQIDPLPTARPAAEQLEAQRQELWNKWKVGLEEALAQPKGAAGASNSLTRSAPAPDNFDRETQNQTTREVQDREREFRRLRAEEAAAAAEQRGGEVGTDSNELIAARRAQHRRDVTREILVNVGLIWSCVGALSVVVPGVIALVTLMGRNFPRGGRAHLSANPAVLWTCGFIIIALGAFLAAQALSKAMRRRVTAQLAALSYEDLLRRFGGPSR